MRTTGLLAIAVLVLAGSVAIHTVQILRIERQVEAAEPVQARRVYFEVAIADMPSNVHTHVAVTGKVTLVKREADGDLHMRLEDAKGNFVTAECIPTLPCLTVPKVGATAMVRGISRFDGEHKWYEVHPVEQIKVQP